MSERVSGGLDESFAGVYEMCSWFFADVLKFMKKVSVKIKSCSFKMLLQLCSVILDFLGRGR